MSIAMRVVLVAVGVAVAAVATAPTVASAADAGGGGGGEAARQVQLPYTFQDEQGNQWVVQQNGVIGPGNADVYDAGGALFVGGDAAYDGQAAAVAFDPTRNEVLLPAVPLGGLRVSRRVAVDARGGLCRWIEVLENRTGTAPVHAHVRVNFDLGGSAQAAQLVSDEKTKQALGLALFDGNRGLAMLAAGRGGKVAPTITWQQNSDQVNLVYDVDVPPRQTVALVHFQAVRGSLDDADTFVRSMKDADVLKQLPADVAPRVLNFPHPQQFAGDVEVLRGDLLDVVELRGGDRYKGTLAHKSYTVQTPYGTIELPAQRVAAMVSVGEACPTQLLITTDGEAFGGTLRLDAITLELSSGQVTRIPLAAVSRFGYRQSVGAGGAGGGGGGGGGGDAGGSGAAEGEPEWQQPRQQPAVLLAGGDRVFVQPPASPIPVVTRYGALRLPPDLVATVAFRADGQPVHEVVLRDGSRFAGLVAADHFDLALRSTGKTVTFVTAGIVKLQLAAAPEVGDSAAVLAMSNGDRLVGTLGGTLMLQTTFDTIAVDAAEVRGLRPTGAGTEVQVTLWDGATLRGRLKDEVVRYALKCGGAALEVPVTLVEEYAQPQPRVPARIAERVRGAVAELAGGDAAARDRAAAALAAMGPAVAELLRSARGQQTPDGRRRIEQILASFDAATRPAPPPVPPAAAGQPVPMPAGAPDGDQILLPTDN